MLDVNCRFDRFGETETTETIAWTTRPKASLSRNNSTAISNSGLANGTVDCLLSSHLLSSYSLDFLLPCDVVMWWEGDEVMVWWGDEVIWWWSDDMVMTRWWGDVVMRDVVMTWWNDVVIWWYDGGGCGHWLFSPLETPDFLLSCDVVMCWCVDGHRVMRWCGDEVMRCGDEGCGDTMVKWWGDVVTRGVVMKWWGDVVTRSVGMRWWGDEVMRWWGDVVVWWCGDVVMVVIVTMGVIDFFHFWKSVKRKQTMQISFDKVMSRKQNLLCSWTPFCGCLTQLCVRNFCRNVFNTGKILW